MALKPANAKQFEPTTRLCHFL